VCLKIIRNGTTNESSFFPLMIMFVRLVRWSACLIFNAVAVTAVLTISISGDHILNNNNDTNIAFI
jgi:hypothetical protein